MVGRTILSVVLALLLSSAAVAADGPIVFRDVTAQTGIAFRHTDGAEGRRYIVETVASGMASFDYDGDGLVDLYFVNGAPLRGSTSKDRPTNRLYRNLGEWRFEDVTDRAGVGDPSFGLGVCVGDYDNDGRPDLYVSNFGPNRLYRNLGNGTFLDVTAKAGVGRGDRVGAGVNFLDIDGDGRLDLFVSNYIGFTYDNHVVWSAAGFPRYAGPEVYPRQPNQLFRNNGDGTFADVSAASGIAAHPGAGMGTVALDYDNDGDTDIFVCNDGAADFLFQNDGRGRFTEVGLAAGVAYNGYGLPMGSMGADAADFDNDGWLDLFETDYHQQYPVLFQNLRDGAFEDISQRAGVARSGLATVKWGCALADFDNDGLRDIFYVCGHLDDNVEQWDPTTRYLARPVLLRNLGNGKFADVSATAGDGLQTLSVGRGLAVDDLDNDGDVDIVVLNSRRPPTILRNDSPKNHWLQVQLRGTKTNRDGVGARVRVTAGDLILTDEVHSGRGYQSHFGSRLHFGLGQRTKIDRVEVRWIGGATESFQNVAIDHLALLVEGTGKPL